MLHSGVPLLQVLQSFLGTDSQGKAATATWLQRLAQLPTLASRRRVVEHFLRTFEHAQLHGSQWRVIGAGAFVGHQHEPAALIERFDQDTGEVTFKLKRRPCPSASAGGLSARSGRSPRQLHRYRASLRDAGLMKSRQPPSDATDARLPKPRGANGQWAYAQHWLPEPPTAEMLSRWRGKKRKATPRRVNVPQRLFTAAQPPRLDDLNALGEHAERQA